MSARRCSLGGLTLPRDGPKLQGGRGCVFERGPVGGAPRVEAGLLDAGALARKVGALALKDSDALRVDNSWTLYVDHGPSAHRDPSHCRIGCYGSGGRPAGG